MPSPPISILLQIGPLSYHGLKPMSKNASQMLRVLLFEASASKADRVSEVLQASGLDFDLTIAATLSEGMEILAGTIFDIVLVNPSLPDSSNLDALSKLSPHASDLAIIALFEEADEPSAIAALRLGIQDCLEFAQLSSATINHALQYAIERTQLRRHLDAGDDNSRKSEDLLQSIFNAIQEAALLLGPNYEIKRLNAAAAALLDDQADRLVGQNFPFEIKIDTPTELEIPETDGSTRLVSLSAVHYGFEENRDILVLLRDLNAPAPDKVATELLTHKLSAAFNAATDAIILSDPNGIIENINESALELLSLTRENAIGRELDKIVRLKHPDSGEVIRDLSKVSTDHKLKEAATTLGFPLELADGQISNVDVKTSPLTDRQNKPVGKIIVLRPVSGEAMVEEELLKAEKLNSISLLAGGIAHDFNNMLASILGNISMVQIELDKDHKHSVKLEAAEKAALQAKSLTQQLLTFAKGGAPVLELTDISEIIEESSKFALRGSNVNCTIEKDAKLWSVKADRGQISQVINNLMINADQAMPKGGTITLRMRNTELDDTAVASLGAGAYLCVEVIDDGIGISEDNLKEIFNPYFTTKASGNGLGLASCQSIIKSHGGAITAKSCVGVGSTFSVFLPKVEEDATEIAPSETPTSEPSEKASIHKGNGRILVMDDMEAMMLVAGEILTVLGYEVEYSTNGDEAIAAYKAAKESDRPFQAVVFDLTVPGGMGGEEAANILKEYDPDLIAIASSGYSTSNIMSDYQDSAFSAVVPKPYRIKEMSDALNRVLSI